MNSLELEALLANLTEEVVVLRALDMYVAVKEHLMGEACSTEGESIWTTTLHELNHIRDIRTKVKEAYESRTDLAFAKPAGSA